ncbi:MAG: replication factor C large subunit [Thermoplasmata archaeon]
MVPLDHEKSSMDWTEKYRPTTLEDITGNNEAKRKLVRWANKWSNDKPKKKAVILAGKAGIGKTSAALALANDMGWEVIEMNASDQRNRHAIKDVVGRSAVDDTFSSSGEFIPYKEGKRTLIILDEADNIFGKEDFGGIREISNVINQTEQPIILIANDYYYLRRRSQTLSNKLQKIDFRPVEKKSIALLLRDICKDEHIGYDPEALMALAERSDGDVRSAVRDLQSIATGRDHIKIEHLDVLGYRNREEEIFPSLRIILQGIDPHNSREVLSQLDEEPRNLITWIDENLPREYTGSKELTKGYDRLSKADVFLGRVYSTQYYRFWAYASDLMGPGVTLSKSHPHRGFKKYAFPTWIRKMTASKIKRKTRDDISKKIAVYTHTTTDRVVSDIFPYFQHLFIEEKDFRKNMVDHIELSSAQAAFLLSIEPESKEVTSLFKEEPKVETKVRKKKEEEKKDQRSLLEF